MYDHYDDEINTIEDEYAILKKLGQGSFGEVYLGQNRKTRMHVAIKAIKLSDKTKMEEFGLWRQEAKLHADTDHENIIKFIKQIELKENAYMIQEYAGGGDLKTQINDRIAQKKKTGAKDPILRDLEASILIKAILNGVKYLHDNGVVHRDIKAQNLLLLTSKDLSKIKVADFGLSAFYHASDLKKLSAKCGTLIYMAPEILKGQAYSKKVDIYSIGILLWICITGKLPFKENNRQDIIKWHMKPKWDFEDGYWSSELKEFFLKLVELDPKERYDVNLAQSHPWITRNFNTKAPMTFQEIQNIFFQKEDMQQAFKTILFINCCRNFEVYEEFKEKKDEKKNTLQITNENHIKQSSISNKKVETHTSNLDYSNIQFPDKINNKALPNKILLERKKVQQVSTNLDKTQKPPLKIRSSVEKSQRSAEKDCIISIKVSTVDNPNENISILKTQKATKRETPFSPYKKSFEKSKRSDLDPTNSRVRAVSKDSSDSFAPKRKNTNIQNCSNDSGDSIFTPHKKKLLDNSFLNSKENSKENERLNSANTKNNLNIINMGSEIKKNGKSELKKSEINNNLGNIKISLQSSTPKKFNTTENVLKDAKSFNQQNQDIEVWESLITVKEKQLSSQQSSKQSTNKHTEIASKRDFQINNSNKSRFKYKVVIQNSIDDKLRNSNKSRDIKSQEDVRIKSNKLVQNDNFMKIQSDNVKLSGVEQDKYQKLKTKMYSMKVMDENSPAVNLRQNTNINTKDILLTQKNRAQLNKSSYNRATSSYYSKDRNKYLGVPKNCKNSKNFDTKHINKQPTQESTHKPEKTGTLKEIPVKSKLSIAKDLQKITRKPSAYTQNKEVTKKKLHITNNYNGYNKRQPSKQKFIDENRCVSLRHIPCSDDSEMIQAPIPNDYNSPLINDLKDDMTSINGLKLKSKDPKNTEYEINVPSKQINNIISLKTFKIHRNKRKPSRTKKVQP